MCPVRKFVLPIPGKRRIVGLSSATDAVERRPSKRSVFMSSA
jgi:hypothetical protein